MKSFNETINIIKINIINYQTLCKNSQQKVLSDTEAFFRNLIPFGKQYGGHTGFQRAEKFITTMEEEIKKGNITKTEQLIDFAANYSDIGGKLHNYIWKSIRESAGFTEAHIDSLIGSYQYDNEDLVGTAIECPSKDESRTAIENLFNRAICGYYEDKLLKYLHSKLGLESNKCADYGKKLLNHLNNKIPELELNTIHQISFD